MFENCMFVCMPRVHKVFLRKTRTRRGRRRREREAEEEKEGEEVTN